MRENQSRNGRAISLTAIFREYCIHWKALVLACLVLGSALTITDYRSRMAGYQVQAAKAGRVQKSDLEARLSDAEKGDVMRALDLNTHLQERVNYQRQNLVNQLNPYHEEYLEIHYLIGARISSAQLISYLQSEDFKSRLAVTLFSQVYPKSDSRYVQELIDVRTGTFDELGDVGLTIGVKLTDESLRQKILDSIDAYMEKTYQMTHTDEKETIRVDQELAQAQVEGEAFLLQMNQQSQELRARLSDDQSKLYQMYVENRQDIVTKAPEMPQADPRQFAIGLFLGAVADLALLCIYLMFSQTLREPEELQEIWNLPLLGKSMQRQARGVRKLLFSGAAYRYFQGRYADEEQAMEDAARQICCSCNLRGIDHLELIPIGKTIEKENRKLLELLAEKGIRMTIRDMEEENGGCQAGTAVVISVAGRGARYMEIDRALTDLDAAGVDLLGAFYAEA